MSESAPHQTLFKKHDPADIQAIGKRLAKLNSSHFNPEELRLITLAMQGTCMTPSESFELIKLDQKYR